MSDEKDHAQLSADTESAYRGLCTNLNAAELILNGLSAGMAGRVAKQWEEMCAERKALEQLHFEETKRSNAFEAECNRLRALIPTEPQAAPETPRVCPRCGGNKRLFPIGVAHGYVPCECVASSPTRDQSCECGLTDAGRCPVCLTLSRPK